MAGSSPVLKARVDADVHQRFLVLARTRGLSESELVRLAINREVDRQAEGVAIDFHPDRDQAEPGRLTVRMPLYVLTAAKDRAKIVGMTASRWVAALVQSNLASKPVLTDAELQAVDVATRELAAIGRNINQIARALNEAHFEAERVRLDRLDELAELVKNTRDEIRALARASRNAWRGQ